MDETVVPSTASFELKFDGIVQTIATVAWTTLNRLSLGVLNPTGPPTTATIELLVEDSNLRAVGCNSVLPFGPETLVAV